MELIWQGITKAFWLLLTGDPEVLRITTLSLITLIPLIAVFIGYNYLANDEEQRLETKFGDEYLAYKKRVGKWIPL